MPSSEHDALVAAFSSAPTLPTEWQQARAQHADNYASFPVPDLKREPVDAGGVFAEWFRAGAGRGAILYVHGGGFALGSIATHASLIGRIAEATETDVLAVDYRLAPEYPAPAQASDVVAAYRFLLDAGYPPKSVAFAGDSAGSGIALSALQQLLRESATMPGAAVLMSGVYDLSLGTESARLFAGSDPLMPMPLVRQMWAAYRGELDESNPLVSPVHGPFEGLPPLLFMVGSTEVLRDESVAVARRATEAGVDARLVIEDGLLHVWPHYAHLIPEGREGIDEIARFVGATIAPAAPVRPRPTAS